MPVVNEGRGYGGHRHRKVLAWARAIPNQYGEGWLALARIGGRWRVVGRRDTERDAWKLALDRARM